MPIPNSRVSWELPGTVWGPPISVQGARTFTSPSSEAGAQWVSPSTWVSFNFTQQYFVVLSVKVLQIFVKFIPRYYKYFS